MRSIERLRSLPEMEVATPNVSCADDVQTDQRSIETRIDLATRSFLAPTVHSHFPWQTTFARWLRSHRHLMAISANGGLC
jgi:hypothetical protein